MESVILNCPANKLTMMNRIDLLRQLFAGGTAVMAGGYVFAGETEKARVYTSIRYLLPGSSIKRVPGLKKT